MADKTENRGLTIRIFFSLAALVLILKAFQLQILDTTYEERARATAVDRFTDYPSRGLIFDRNEVLLVNNNPVYDLLVTYSQLDPEMDTLGFCQLLKIDREEFERRLDKDFRDIRYDKKKPFVFMRSIPSELFARFQESLYQFPGFVVQKRKVRGYPEPYAAHVLGFIRGFNDQEVEQEDYNLGDYIGASGLEKQYELHLRGKKGHRFVLKDNLGQNISKFQDGALDVPAVSGNDLMITLDIELQQFGEELMKNKIGGI
ncbi:MAG: penicillin-binding protein 2, partial [Phaeodactylibacter sp.]|nr:penicillin-binding protein 2 [Phaeodactylibacter sp.]